MIVPVPAITGRKDVGEVVTVATRKPEGDAVSLGIAVGILVGTGVFDGTGVSEGTGVTVGVSVGTKVGVFVGVSVGVEVAVAVGVGVGVGVGTCRLRCSFTSANVSRELCIHNRKVTLPAGSSLRSHEVILSG